MSDRLKIAYVDERALLGFLQCWRQGEFVSLPTGPQIPQGCEIVRVWHCPDRRALAVMLEHPHFPRVPDGEQPPSISQFVWYEALRRIPVACHFSESIY